MLGEEGALSVTTLVAVVGFGIEVLDGAWAWTASVPAVIAHYGAMVTLSRLEVAMPSVLLLWCGCNPCQYRVSPARAGAGGMAMERMPPHSTKESVTSQEV